jgi:midasin (ATPase involved in ribosome maturation)
MHHRIVSESYEFLPAVSNMSVCLIYRTGDQLDSDEPRKRRKVYTLPHSEIVMPTATVEDWKLFGRDVDLFEAQHIHGKAKLAFAFVEGPLARAIREGHW